MTSRPWTTGPVALHDRAREQASRGTTSGPTTSNNQYGYWFTHKSTDGALLGARVEKNYRSSFRPAYLNDRGASAANTSQPETAAKQPNGGFDTEGTGAVASEHAQSNGYIRSQVGGSGTSSSSVVGATLEQPEIDGKLSSQTMKSQQSESPPSQYQNNLMLRHSETLRGRYITPASGSVVRPELEKSATTIGIVGEGALLNGSYSFGRPINNRANSNRNHTYQHTDPSSTTTGSRLDDFRSLQSEVPVWRNRLVSRMSATHPRLAPNHITRMTNTITGSLASNTGSSFQNEAKAADDWSMTLITPLAPTTSTSSSETLLVDRLVSVKQPMPPTPSDRMARWRALRSETTSGNSRSPFGTNSENDECGESNGIDYPYDYRAPQSRSWPRTSAEAATSAGNDVKTTTLPSTLSPRQLTNSMPAYPRAHTAGFLDSMRRQNMASAGDDHTFDDYQYLSTNHPASDHQIVKSTPDFNAVPKRSILKKAKSQSSLESTPSFMSSYGGMYGSPTSNPATRPSLPTRYAPTSPRQQQNLFRINGTAEARLPVVPTTLDRGRPVSSQKRVTFNV